jgi:hypothetical protein
MSKFWIFIMALVVMAPLSCADKAADTDGAKAPDAPEVEINFLIEQDRWGEIAPCG